jgi:S-adenosylmethionine:tRNA ribosyltransferase-isomerase
MSFPIVETKTFEYALTDAQIAKYPLPKRNQSKLLIYSNGSIEESAFYKIEHYIPSGYLLVFNDTKVLPARILFKKTTGAIIEIFLLEPFTPRDYAQNLNSTDTCQWLCFVGNVKKWKPQDNLFKTLTINGEDITVKVGNISSQQNAFVIEFEWDKKIPFLEILNHVGQVPIPPYLKRESEAIDFERYQTIFSKYLGSVAAPTASLHFTDTEFSQFEQKKIDTTYLTLHVGAGTFKPMSSEYIHEHQLHTELFQVTKATLQNIIHHYPNIIAVGTTSLRSLESIYHVGNQLINNPEYLPDEILQWCEYDSVTKHEPLDALNALLSFLSINQTDKINIRTQLMISPGYQIKMVKGLITNFHQPRSSLLALVAAFVGEDWKKIYDYALSHQFRFLSYGDSSILFNPN